AAIYVASIAVFTVALVRRGVPHHQREGGSVRGELRHLRDLVRSERKLQAFLVANALWELSLAALKTFVVLYVTETLGFSRNDASLMIGGVAVLVLLAALASGKLADRFGAVRVMAVALPIHGAGFIVPCLFGAKLLVALAVPFIAIGGGMIMALPYAILMPLMPDDERGALTGYYSLSRGLGTWLGPLLAGLAIGAAHSYQAVWGVCAAAILLSLVPLRRL